MSTIQTFHLTTDYMLNSGTSTFEHVDDRRNLQVNKHTAYAQCGKCRPNIAARSNIARRTVKLAINNDRR